MAKVSIRDGALEKLKSLYPDTTTTEAVMSAVNEVIRLRDLLLPVCTSSPVVIPLTSISKNDDNRNHAAVAMHTETSSP